MAAVDWSSLPSDLVRRVADVFLTTCDVDYYMGLRAVCGNWRASIDDPRGPDPRFRPRRWVMIEKLAGADGSCSCLFLHVDTGRFLWRDLSVFPGDDCMLALIAATEDGLLVLEAKSDSKMCVLNPLTGHLVRSTAIAAQFPRDVRFGISNGRSVFAAGSSPMVLYRLCGSSGRCIDLTRDDLDLNRELVFEAKPALDFFSQLVPFKGRAYAVDTEGAVAVVEHNCGLDEEPEVISVVSGHWKQDRPTFLVDNAGELLLVRLMNGMSKGGINVFRVDVENGVLEQVESIGNRAIFLGQQRCLSVDASNLPAIERNCIYSNHDKLYMHRLQDGSHEQIFEVWGFRIKEEDQHCPHRLARVLVEYTYYDIMSQERVC